MVSGKPTSKEGNRQQAIGNSEQEAEERGEASDGPFEFSPELIAKMEEIESLPVDDPSRAERILAAVAEGANELRAQGLGLMDFSPVAGSPTR